MSCLPREATLVGILHSLHRQQLVIGCYLATSRLTTVPLSTDSHWSQLVRLTDVASTPLIMIKIIIDYPQSLNGLWRCLLLQHWFHCLVLNSQIATVPEVQGCMHEFIYRTTSRWLRKYPEIYGLHFLLVQVVAYKSTAFLQQPKRWSCLWADLW